MKSVNLIITAVLILGSLTFYSQVAINTDGSAANASAMLDIQSTDKGLLVPRLTQTQRDAITSPETGLLVYQSDNTTGFYFYNGSEWVVIGSEATDINSLVDGKTSGNSVFLGEFAGDGDNDSDNNNVGIGVNALFSNTSGSVNTVIGNWSLDANTAGIANSAIGTYSLTTNTTGSSNTALGYGSLTYNLTGNSNTAIGLQSLHNNSTGTANTAVGLNAGSSLVSGTGNVFLGYEAGKNETGSNKLYISNSDASNPLIYGDFNANTVALNGKVCIGTSNPNASASLEISSSTGGFLPPRMTRSQRDAINSPATGLMIYNTDDNVWQGFNGTNWVYVDGESCAPVAGTITGPAFVSYNASGKVYSISAATGADSYNWTVPTGASITAGQGTTSITVTFGSENGNVSVCTVSGCGNGEYTDMAVDVGTINIGDNYQGGVIAYIFEPGDPGYDANVPHGLIVALNETTLVTDWGCKGTGINTGTAIGTGSGNMSSIIVNCSTPGIAAKVCYDYTNPDTGTGVYSDWYLPSKDEVNKIYLNNVVLGIPSGITLWSSSEYDDDNAWTQSLFDGGQSFASKDVADVYNAIPVRTF